MNAIKQIILILTIIICICTQTYAIETIQIEQIQTYEYYGIVQGDGTTTNVYLKIGSMWQQYNINDTTIQYNCKIIEVDKEITETNYTEIKIINIKETNKTETTKINNTINNWNNYIKRGNNEK